MGTPKRLIRPRKGLVLGGVCLALANYFTIDVTIVRLIWIFLLLPGVFQVFSPTLFSGLQFPQKRTSHSSF